MRNLTKVFWDTQIKDIDFKKQKDFVIARVLEHGRLADVEWLLKKYRRAAIKKTICQTHNLSEKTANFWSTYFKIPSHKIICLKKPYLKKRKMFWPY